MDTEEFAAGDVGYVPQGYGHYEYTFWWGFAMFAIALHGGGPYSLDRQIGREL